MIGLGVAAAALVAFVVSAVYYALAMPLERRVVGAAALDRGRPGPVKVLAELARTVVVALIYSWIAKDTGDLVVGNGIVLAVILWVGFPLVLLSGSVIWEKVPLVTAAVHAGDWLLKLVLIAVVLGLVH